MSGAAFGGFASGLARGLQTGYGLSLQKKARELAEQQQGMQQFETILKLMEAPTATRMFLAQDYMKRMGMDPKSTEGKNFLGYLQKAQDADRQALLEFGQAVGFRNLTPQALEYAMKNPSVMTQLLKTAQEKQEQAQAASLLGIELPGAEGGGAGQEPQSFGDMQASAEGAQPEGAQIGPQEGDTSQSASMPEADLAPAAGPGQQQAMSPSTPAVAPEQTPGGAVLSPEGMSARDARIKDLRRRRDLALALGKNDIAKALNQQMEDLGYGLKPSERYHIGKSGENMVLWDMYPEDGGQPRVIKTYATPSSGKGTGTGKAASTVGKLIQDREAARAKGASPEDIAVYDQAIAKALSTSTRIIRSDGNGKFEMIEGPSEDVNTLETGAAKDRAREMLGNLDNAIADVDRILQIAKDNPQYFGASGSVLDFLRSAVGLGVDLSGLAAGALGFDPRDGQAMAKWAAEFAPGIDVGGLFPPDASEVELLENTLAVVYARALNPDGRLLAQNLETARKATKLTGLKSSSQVIQRVEALRAKFQQLRDATEKKLGGKPGEGAGDPNAAFDDIFGTGEGDENVGDEEE